MTVANRFIIIRDTQDEVLDVDIDTQAYASVALVAKGLAGVEAYTIYLDNEEVGQLTGDEPTTGLKGGPVYTVSKTETGGDSSLIMYPPGKTK